MGKLNSIILVLALWLALCGTVSAAELHVGSGQTYSTIRSAVDAAGGGDVIIVHAGSYTNMWLWINGSHWSVRVRMW